MNRNKNKIFLFLILFSLLSWGFSKSTISDNWQDVFEKYKANGTFVLYNLTNKDFKYFNKNRSDSGYIPASTFKIINSLIALETNAITDEYEIIKWDGIDKGWSKWNKDQNMKSAFILSCVWFYQELAKRIGKNKMQLWIDSVNYGNKKMGGEIENFWLQGDLRISANEQINFLNRLINNKLPFKPETQRRVKNIMVTDSTSKYIVHSKTGWGTSRTPQIGWFVGYVETGNGIWIFAMNMDIRNRSDLPLRKNITYSILRAERIIE